MGRTWTKSQEAAMTLRGKTLLVSAAAGSGKTSVLTERIIRSLMDEEHPADLSRMLVVTFTRAAAAELKGRISKALSDALAEHPDNKHLSRQLFLLGSAQISTIDSFFQRAVRANFEQLGLPASFRPADAGEILPLRREILDGLIEEFYEHYETDTDVPLFERLSGNRFAAVVDHLISDRSDGKLSSVLLEFAEALSSEPRGVEALHACAEILNRSANGEYFDSPYGAVIKSHTKTLARSWIDYLERFFDHLESAPDMSHAASGLVQSDLNFCRALLGAVHENSYARAKEVVFSFVSGRFPTIKNKTKEVVDYQAWRNQFKSDVTKRLGTWFCAPAEHIKEEMLATGELCEMLYRFYGEWNARLLREKKERGILEYDDVRAMLLSLLETPDGTHTPFADRLAEQYDAVYIDEYQDVDFLQDRIFSAIGRNHRFMVGDIKQSIYGFRGSEPSIFANYRRAMPLYTEEGSEEALGNCVFMSENFRCDRPVIRFANRVCSFLFSACDESVGYRPEDDLVCSKPSPDTLPERHPCPVEFAVFDAPVRAKGEEECETEHVREEPVWVASAIKKLLTGEILDDGRPIRPDDIAILVRNRAHGEQYARELEKLNIPVAAASSGNLLHDPLLCDLLNLLRAIDNPYRDLPLSEFLLSTMGGFDLEEITQMRDGIDSGVSLFDALQKASEADGDLCQKCRVTLDFLARQRNAASTLSADRFLRLLYLEDRICPHTQSPALLFLYEQSRVYGRTAFCGLYGFLSFMDRLLESEKISADGFCKAERAVTIMTIHQSKGLEFPVVFLSSTGSRFNKDDIKKTLLYHRRAGLASHLYNRETGMSEDTSLRSAVKLLIDEEETEECIRTLYVALTRARERLYVTGTLQGKWENTLTAADLIRKNDRPSILGSPNLLTWLLAALRANGRFEEDIDWRLMHNAYGSVTKETPLALGVQHTDKPAASELSQSFAQTLRRRASFVYEQEALQKLPTKLAASKICPDLLDQLDEENATDALQMQLELMRSSVPAFEGFLQAENEPSAAEIGTATHAFLEFCDFDALSERSIDEECHRLLSYGWIGKDTATRINRAHLKAFCQSDLYTSIRSASHVRREVRFGIFYPAQRLTKKEALRKQLGTKSIFVQGSIDLLLETKDKRILLIDYKTDHIAPSLTSDSDALRAHMLASHGNQLAVYAKAVEELFGKYPDEISIYSIPLGRLIPLPLDELLQKT